MGKHIHKLTEINENNKTATCAACGIVPVLSKKGSNGNYYWRCKPNKLAVDKKGGWRGKNSRYYSYARHKKELCNICGFIPEHMSQLDVDHIDGDHYNNSLENLQTICANCHRLKTYKQKWASQLND